VVSYPLPLPQGEEEPGLEGAERGGYSPIPRRDVRAGVRGTGDASAEPNWPQWPERPDGSESLSVFGRVSSEEQSVETVCEEREGAGDAM